MNSNPEISYKELYKFFLPLAVMPMLVGLVYNLLNASIARLPYPEISLAVFAVALSMTNIIKSPIHMSRQTLTALADDQESFKFVSRFIIFLGILFFVMIASLGYTPLGVFVFRRLIGLSDPQEINFAVQAMRIMAFIPLVESVRNIYQGLAISLKKTELLTPAVIARMAVIILMLFFLTRSRVFSGIVVGSTVRFVGMAVEMLAIYFALRLSVGKTKEIVKKLPKLVSKKVNLKSLIKFFLPVAFMAFLARFVQPVVQSGIIRSSITTYDLAAYGVTWTLVKIFIGALDMLNQCSLVYAKNLNHKNWYKIVSFSISVGIIVSFILVILALTPIGDFILKDLISVSPEIAAISKKVILAFILFPIFRAFRETFWGIMFQRQRTNIMAGAKVAGLIFVALVFIILSLTTEINSAVIAAVALTAGEAADALTISLYVKKKRILKLIYAENN